MDVREVAAYLRISPGTLYHWIGEGKAPLCVRVSSRCIRWRKSDVDAWISDRVARKNRKKGPR